jgi:DNA-binding GntR family transcriptional regulator
MIAIFKAEKRPLLVEQVTKQIREAIKNGLLKPGDRLIETDLAKNMQIGRNAVREAIRYLEKEGLVSTTPFKGAYVKVLTEKDLEDLYALRMALEELAIKTLIGNLDDNKISRLKTIVDKMKQVSQNGDVEEIIDADIEFHRTICELSGNLRLLEAWLNLSHQLKAFIGLEDQLYDDDTPETTLGLHYPVFEAIINSDSKLSVKLMHAVITRGYKKACKHYKKRFTELDESRNRKPSSR